MNVKGSLHILGQDLCRSMNLVSPWIQGLVIPCIIGSDDHWKGKCKLKKIVLLFCDVNFI